MIAEDCVSVIVPTRDRQELLLRALRSVERQTYRNHEVIVVDDGSLIPVDDAARVISNCRVVRNQRPLGPAASRNIGARLARGTFIAFLDDDDCYLPDKLRRSLGCLLAYPSAVGLFHRMASRSTNTGTSRGCALLISPVTRMLLEQPPHVDQLLVRTDVHRRVGFDESFPAAADLDYCLRLAQQGPLVDLDEVLALRGNEEASLVEIERRIEGRKLFATKHQDLLRAHPGALAYHRFRLGHLYFRAKRRKHAVAIVLRAAFSRRGIVTVLPRLAVTVVPKQLQLRSRLFR